MVVKNFFLGIVLGFCLAATINTLPYKTHENLLVWFRPVSSQEKKPLFECDGLCDQNEIERYKQFLILCTIAGGCDE